MRDFFIKSTQNFLSARSPVFKAMITGDFQEKSKNQAKLTDFSPESFLDFLNFLYTDNVQDIKTHVLDLLQMANLYQVNGLRELCEKTLLAGLTEENAGDVFQYAHLYECGDTLKKKSFEIIKG